VTAARYRSQERDRVRERARELSERECACLSPNSRPCRRSYAARRTVRSENEMQQVGRGFSLAGTQTANIFTQGDC